MNRHGVIDTVYVNKPAHRLQVDPRGVQSLSCFIGERQSPNVYLICSAKLQWFELKWGIITMIVVAGRLPAVVLSEDSFEVATTISVCQKQRAYHFLNNPLNTLNPLIILWMSSMKLIDMKLIAMKLINISSRWVDGMINTSHWIHWTIQIPETKWYHRFAF